MGLRISDIWFWDKQLARVMEQNRKVNRAAHGLTMHKQAVLGAHLFRAKLARIPDSSGGLRPCCQRRSNPVGTVVISSLAVASFSSTFR